MKDTLKDPETAAAGAGLTPQPTAASTPADAVKGGGDVPTPGGAGAGTATPQGSPVHQCLSGLLGREGALGGFGFLPEQPDESLGAMDREQWRWTREGSRLRQEGQGIPGAPGGKGESLTDNDVGGAQAGKAAPFPADPEARAAYVAAALFPGQAPSEFVRLARVLAPDPCEAGEEGTPVLGLTERMERCGLGLVSRGGRRGVDFLEPGDAVGSRRFVLERYPVLVVEGLGRLLEEGFLRGSSPAVFEGALGNLRELGADDPGLVRFALEQGVLELFPTADGGAQVAPFDQRRMLERFVRLVGTAMRVPLDETERESLLLEGLGGLVRRGAVGVFSAVAEAITSGCPAGVLVELYRRMDEALAGSEGERRVLHHHLWQRMLEPIPEGDLGFWRAMLAGMARVGPEGTEGGFAGLLEDAVGFHLLDGLRHPLLFAVLSRERGGVVGRLSARVLAQVEGGQGLTAALASVLDAVGMNAGVGGARAVHPLCGLIPEVSGGPGGDGLRGFWERMLLDGARQRLGERGLHVLASLEQWKRHGGEGGTWAGGVLDVALDVVTSRLDGRGLHAARESCAALSRQCEEVRQACTLLSRSVVRADQRQWLGVVSRAAAGVGGPMAALRGALGGGPAVPGMKGGVA